MTRAVVIGHAGEADLRRSGEVLVSERVFGNRGPPERLDGATVPTERGTSSPSWVATSLLVASAVSLSCRDPWLPPRWCEPRKEATSAAVKL